MTGQYDFTHRRKVSPVCNHRIGVTNHRYIHSHTDIEDISFCRDDEMLFDPVSLEDYVNSVRFDKFHFCPDCGCEINWRYLTERLKVYDLQNPV